MDFPYYYGAARMPMSGGTERWQLIPGASALTWGGGAETGMDLPLTPTLFYLGKNRHDVLC